MAILLLTGTPGAGKSYSAVALAIVPALNMGRPIRTNIPLLWEEISQVWPEVDAQPFDIEDPDAWGAIPGGALIVLDEIWKFWPVGSKQTDATPAAVELLRMHRHRVGRVGDRDLSQEIVLINQGKRFAAWIKDLVDKTYVIRKLDAVGADKRYRCDIYQGFQDTDRPLKREHIRGYVGKYQPKYFAYYRSHTQGQVTEGINPEELRADRKATVWSSGGMKAAILAPFVAVFALWYLIDNVNAFIGVDEVPAPVAAKPAEPLPRAVSVAPPKPPSQPVPSPASNPATLAQPSAGGTLDRLSEWRLSAFVRAEEGTSAGEYAVVLTRGRDRRYLRGVPCQERQGETWCQVDEAWVSGHTGVMADVWSAVDPGPPAGS